MLLKKLEQPINDQITKLYWITQIRPEAATRCEKETLAQVFSCEFCEISKNTFFPEHLWTTASIRRQQ